MTDYNLFREFWQKAGVEVIENDEVGYKRAHQFSSEIGLNWSQDWYRIYDGKVYVNPNGGSDELQRRFGENTKEG